MPPSRPSPVAALVAAGTVLPHEDGPSVQLSDLSLASAPGSPFGPSASSSIPASPPQVSSSRRRRRTCSPCSHAVAGTVSVVASVSDGGDRSGAPCHRPRRLTATDPPCPAAADAQVSPMLSHELSREVMNDAPASDVRRDGQVGRYLQHADEDMRDVVGFGRDFAQQKDQKGQTATLVIPYGNYGSLFTREEARVRLPDLPNELLLHILSFLDVCDLLAASRASHQLRSLSLTPILHHLRLRRTRAVLTPLLTSPSRPSLADLIARSIFLTRTTVVSRKLARSLTAIRLSRRLAVRPSPQVLVERCVLPPECVPGHARVAPALVGTRRAIEKERVKDSLRKWVGSVWERRVREKAEDRRRWEERVGVGRVWRLRRFWERVGKGEIQANLTHSVRPSRSFPTISPSSPEEADEG